MDPSDYKALRDGWLKLILSVGQYLLDWLDWRWRQGILPAFEHSRISPCSLSRSKMLAVFEPFAESHSRSMGRGAPENGCA